MRLKNLETLYWVARLGSFRRAAEKLHATQPAISARIAALEQEFGVTLLSREGRHTRPTSAGLEALRYAEKMLELNAGLHERFGGGWPRGGGTLRIGVSETLVHTWLPALLAELQRRYADCNIEIQVDITPSLRAALLARELDLAFLVGPLAEPSITNHDVCRYPMGWFASPGLKLPARLDAAELAAYPLITFPRRTRPAANLQRLLKGAKLPPLKISYSSSLTAIARLTELGFGISTMPRAVALEAVADGRLCEVHSDDATLDDLLFSASYPQSPDDALWRDIAELAQRLARATASA